jgi:DNA primase
LNKSLATVLAEKNVSRKILDQFGICYYRDGSVYGAANPLWSHKISTWPAGERLVYPLYDLHGIYKGLAFRTPGLKFFYDTTENVQPAEILYGLHETKACIAEQEYAIVLEGMFDFLKLYESGIGNVVTTQGTYLSWDQMCLLRRFCRCALICYDPDDAGREAAEKAADTLRRGGILPVIVDLDEEIDPDEYVMKHGKQKFLETCFRSLNATDSKQSIDL